MKKLIFLFLFSIYSFSTFAQLTTASGTIVDTDGTTWFNAKVTATFVPNPAYPQQSQYNINGVSITSNTYAQYLNQTVTSNASGVFSMTLLDNTQVAPSGSSWKLVIQSWTSAPSSSSFPNIVVSGTSQNLSSFITTNITAPRFSAVSGFYGASYGYGTNEVSTTPLPGGSFFNVSTGAINLWTCIASSCGWSTINTTFGNYCALVGCVYTGAIVGPSATFTNLVSGQFNGSVNAALASGSDIGAQINSAIATVGCGEVYVPAGTYTQTTTIMKPRCVNLHGASADSTILNYTPTTGVAVIAGDTLGIYNYPVGQLADLTLYGPFAGTNIGVSTGGGTGCTGCYGDHQNFNRVRITGFTTGVQFGNNSFMIAFLESVITNNGVGISNPTGLTNSGESIDFMRVSVQNNVTGLSLLGFGDFHFHSSTCDYNTSMCGTVCQADFFGEHIEQLSGTLINIDNTCQAGPKVTFYGGGFYHTGTYSGTDPQMITVSNSVNPVLKLDGLQLTEAHTLGELVNWTSTATNGKLDIENPSYYNGSIVQLVNTCTFIGCKIQDNQGNYVYHANSSSVTNAGDAVYNTVTAAGGAGLSYVSGVGEIHGSGTLRLDNVTGGTTPCYLGAGDLNCIGNTFFASELATNQTPTSSTTASDHSVPIILNGTTYYMRLSTTP